MFVATEVVDSLSIQPSAFEDVFDVALENAIRRKYSDKVGQAADAPRTPRRAIAAGRVAPAAGR